MLERLVCVELWIEGSIDGYDKIEMEFHKKFRKVECCLVFELFSNINAFFFLEG